MRTEHQTDIILLQLAAAELELNGNTFLDPKYTLSNLPVIEMSIRELETELELLKVVYGIFRGTGGDPTLASTMQPVIDMYGNRIRDIENEIFERKVLV